MARPPCSRGVAARSRESCDAVGAQHLPRHPSLAARPADPHPPCSRAQTSHGDPSGRLWPERDERPTKDEGPDWRYDFACWTPGSTGSLLTRPLNGRTPGPIAAPEERNDARRSDRDSRTARHGAAHHRRAEDLVYPAFGVLHEPGGGRPRKGGHLLPHLAVRRASIRVLRAGRLRDAPDLRPEHLRHEGRGRSPAGLLQRVPAPRARAARRAPRQRRLRDRVSVSRLDVRARSGVACRPLLHAPAGLRQGRLRAAPDPARGVLRTASSSISTTTRRVSRALRGRWRPTFAGACPTSAT